MRRYIKFSINKKSTTTKGNKTEKVKTRKKIKIYIFWIIGLPCHLQPFYAPANRQSRTLTSVSCFVRVSVLSINKA